MEKHYNVGKDNPSFKYVISRNFLMEQYIKRDKPQAVIAKMIDCNVSVIYNRLKKYNIPIKTISEWRKGKFLHENNPNFRNGKFCKSCCIDCGKEIIYGNERCIKCWRKFNRGYNHFNYKHGKSREPYPLEWTETLKESIRQRDNYTCQLCDILEIECNRKLSIHHIDYNKENLNPNNLISLCKRCNPKVNFNRVCWMRYFKTLMEKKSGVERI